MRHIDSAYSSPELEELKRKAAEKKKELIEAYREDPESAKPGDFYREFKQELRNSHNGLCAYCEAKVRGHPGDVEHYRPKNKVTDLSGAEVFVDHAERGRIQHPGYFWKAYDWDNLLLSCSHCNGSYYHDTEDGQKKFGKLNMFHVDGARAFDPDHDLDDEEPRLLNPVHEDPTRYLEYDTDIALQPIDDNPKAKHTIELLGLNERGDVVDGRNDAYHMAMEVIFEFTAAVGSGSLKTRARKAKFIDAIISERAEFLTAKKLGLFSALQQLEENGFTINLRDLVEANIDDPQEYGSN